VRLARRPPAVRHRGRDTTLRTGAIAAVVIALGLYYSVTKSLPFIPSTGGRLVRAQFSEPNQLTSKTPVRVDGIDVGTVSSVALAPGHRGGIVTMRITDGAVHLHADASAAIKFRTLLGSSMAVDLDPGSPSAPPLDGATIPLARTSAQTEFDDVLQVFSHDTPAALRTDLAQLSSSFHGTAAERLVDSLAPTLQDVPAGLGSLQGQMPDDLQNLIDASANTAAAIGADRARLEGLVAGAQGTFRATTNAAPQLAATVERAPAAMDATVAVSHAIDATLPSLNTLSEALLPGALLLGPAATTARPAATRLDEVLRAAEPLVARLRPAVDQLAAAAAPGTRVVTGLQPTVMRLNASVIPWLKHPDSDLRMPVYQLIGPTVATLASAASEYDDFGQILHFPIAPGAGSLGTIPCTVFVADPTAPELVRCEALNQLVGDLLKGKL
jgi:phospholipid/cholesterol/gamma-HCH transport system substrate-binding protein